MPGLPFKMFDQEAITSAVVVGSHRVGRFETGSQLLSRFGGGRPNR